VEVSKDEAKALSPAALFHSVVYRAMTQCAEDIGAANAILDPLHLGELPFIFSSLFMFLVLSGLDLF
jgi:hypothetical protein